MKTLKNHRRAPAPRGVAARPWHWRRKTICENHRPGGYYTTVIDLLKQPQLARDDQILALPTVVRQLPKPAHILFGTLSDTEGTLAGRDLRADG